MTFCKSGYFAGKVVIQFLRYPVCAIPDSVKFLGLKVNNLVWSVWILFQLIDKIEENTTFSGARSSFKQHGFASVIKMLKNFFTSGREFFPLLFP